VQSILAMLFCTLCFCKKFRRKKCQGREQRWWWWWTWTIFPSTV